MQQILVVGFLSPRTVLNFTNAKGNKADEDPCPHSAPALEEGDCCQNLMLPGSLALTPKWP